MNIDRIDEYIDDVESNIDNLYDKMQKLKPFIEKIPDAKPFKQDEYNMIFDGLENTRDTIENILVPKMHETKHRIDVILDKMGAYLSLLSNVEKTINNQHLSSGLQGMIKRKIREQPNSRRIIESLPDTIRQRVKSKKYKSAPTNKGGKSHTSKNKSKIKIIV